MSIFPAHVLQDGRRRAYLEDYNFKLLPGTGPYIVDEADIDKGNGDHDPAAQRLLGGKRCAATSGSNNFDEIRESSSGIENLAFEMFKKGDLDFYYVNISREWVEELNFDHVQRGLIQKRKVFNDNPSGSRASRSTRAAAVGRHPRAQGAAPSANRELLIEKLFFNEYVAA